VSQPPVFPEGDLPLLDVPPRHGFQGDRGASAGKRSVPAGLTIALSREAGSRGGTIARRAGRELGWAVYDQELLEYMAQESAAREGALSGLSEEARAWVEARLEQMLRRYNLSEQPLMTHIARIVLAVGAAGEAVLIGRGAGCLLPRETTLNVRVVAPLDDRIAYMSQWLRLPTGEAAERVRLRDERRSEYMAKHFGRQAGDVHQYDLVLNSSFLGEDLCTDLLVTAARGRAEPWQGEGGGGEGSGVVS
jgi:cytidylate kinase